jgi:hypothetical protein
MFCKPALVDAGRAHGGRGSALDNLPGVATLDTQ